MPTSDPASDQTLSPGEFAALLKEFRSVRRTTDERLTSLERVHADRLDRLNRLWDATVSDVGRMAHRLDRLEASHLALRLERIEAALGIADEELEPVRVRPSPKPKSQKVSRGNQGHA